MQKKQGKLLMHKLFFTFVIVLFYLVGRKIPLCGIDIAQYRDLIPDAGGMIMNTIGGDYTQCSIFLLGISPMMISTIGVQTVVTMGKKNKTMKISQIQMNRIIVGLLVLIAVIEAGGKMQNMAFLPSVSIVAKVVAFLEMITGALLILFLAEQNKKYGIGGQTTLIYVNILDSFCRILRGQSRESLLWAFIFSIPLLLIVFFMENTEKHIPVQRIAIQNIYGENNYMAIKLNPIGIMPIMFSAAFFMIPQLLLSMVAIWFPNQKWVMTVYNRMVLTHPLGIIVYLFLLYLITLVFSRVLLNPEELAEQMQKSGDCIEGIRPGKETQKYLSRVINSLGFVSATVMALCVGIPLYLQVIGSVTVSLSLVPATVMMATGIWCSLYRETEAVRYMDSYQPFL